MQSLKIKNIFYDKEACSGIDKKILEQVAIETYQKDNFTSGMADSYRAMAEHMPDNGIQIIMFGHRKLSVWLNLLKALSFAGLKIVKTWQIATETNHVLKPATNIKDTVVLVLRKRLYSIKNISSTELKKEIKKSLLNVDANLIGLDLLQNKFAHAIEPISHYTHIDKKSVFIEDDCFSNLNLLDLCNGTK